MSKTMLLVVLASFTTSLIGCGEGPQRNTTANQAILKMRCQSPLAFGGNPSSDKENDNLEQIIAAKYSKTNVPAVVTYVTKFEGSAILNQEKFKNVAITSDLGEEFQDSAHQFVVTKDCETLTANVRGPGIEYAGMTIKSIGMQEIELSLSKDAVETSIKMKKEGRTKIKISGNRRFVGRDTTIQKNLEAQDFANGNVILKVNITAKSNGADSKVSFEQLSGPMDNSHKVKLATPVVTLLTGMTDDQAKKDILELAIIVPKEVAAAEGKLTPDMESGPKEVEINILALVDFQENVLENAAVITPAVEPGAPAPVTDGTIPAAAAPAAPASPTEPSTPAVAVVVK